MRTINMSYALWGAAVFFNRLGLKRQMTKMNKCEASGGMRSNRADFIMKSGAWMANNV